MFAPTVPQKGQDQVACQTGCEKPEKTPGVKTTGKQWLLREGEKHFATWLNHGVDFIIIKSDPKHIRI